MLCNECDRRNTCKTLGKDAEEYTHQDDPNYHKPGEGLHFTPIEKKILTLLSRGRSKEYIRECLKLSVHGLNVHISNLRKKSQEIVL